MIDYYTNLENIKPEDVEGFFVGWGNSPDCEKLWQILNNSSFKVLAIEKSENKPKVVGFVAALSDQILTVYVSLLEVLPEFQGLGIGKTLMSKMLELTTDFYMVDLVCDESLVDFYEKFGMKKMVAMSKRNYKAQSGKKP